MGQVTLDTTSITAEGTVEGRAQGRGIEYPYIYLLESRCSKVSRD